MLGRGAKYLFVPFGMTMFSPIVYASGKEESSDSLVTTMKRAPWDVYCEPPSAKKTDDESSCTKPVVAELEKCIQKCREDFGPIQSSAAEYISQGKEFVGSVNSTVNENVKYLQTSASDEMKYATIAGAGVLSGLILGFRKRLFKKLIYTALGSGATAAIIYPQQAKLMAKEGSIYAREGFKAAYAAITGKDQENDKSGDNKKRKKEKRDVTTS